MEDEVQLLEARARQAEILSKSMVLPTMPNDSLEIDMVGDGFHKPADLR